jgi:hypothetical protein
VAACPECGDRVPLGGGRTVKNAHTMFELVRALSSHLKPDEEGVQARRFCNQGRALAESLHAYGHRYSMINPDWSSAGLWTQQAKTMARNIGL